MMRRERIILLSIILGALILRLALGFFYFAPDSVLYLETAEAIQHGRWWIDQYWDESLIDGKLYLSPLYTTLTAFVQPVIRDWVWSGVVVSLAASLGSILVAYGFLRSQYSSRTAQLGAVLVATFPLFIKYSTLVLTDSLFVLLIGLVVVWSWRLVAAPSVSWRLIGLGLLVGLCYLARTIGLVTGLVISVWILYDALRRREQWRPLLLRVSMFGLGCLLIIAPYVLYLHVQTGQVLLGGQQSAVVRMIGMPWQRILTSDNMIERTVAMYSVDASGMMGIERNMQFPFADVLIFAGRNIAELFIAFFILMLPLMLGLFWRRQHVATWGRREFFLCVWIFVLIGSYGISAINVRYLLPAFYIFILLAAPLLDQLFQQIAGVRAYRAVAASGTVVFVGFVVLISPLIREPYPRAASLYLREQGEIERQLEERLRNLVQPGQLIMSHYAYHAYVLRTKFVPLPNATQDQFIKLAARFPITYIVFDSFYDNITRPLIYQTLVSMASAGGNLTEVYRYDGSYVGSDGVTYLRKIMVYQVNNNFAEYAHQ